MTQNIQLKIGKLYILSGLQASGKSTFLKNVPEHMIVSSDQIRASITGFRNSVDQNGVMTKYLSDDSDIAVFSIIKTIIEEKCRLGLTVFFDATNINDINRREFVNIAKKHNMKSEILILNTTLEQAILNNKNREDRVNEYNIEKFNSKLELTSVFDYQIIDTQNYNSFNINFIPNEILEKNIDIISDIHGLLDHLLELLSSLGYIVNQSLIYHPEGRKLVFLGDFIDRGPDSLEVVDLIRIAVSNGHYAIIGNHEQKLISAYRQFSEGKEILGGISGKITLTDLLKRKVKYQEKFISFLQTLPFYYIQKNPLNDLLFVHGNINYGDPMTLTRTDSIYGVTRRGQYRDTDSEYQTLFDLGLNKYTLIRGHVPQTSPQANCISIEEEQAYGGYLVGLPIDNGVIGDRVRIKSSFNFDNINKDSLLFNLDNLVSNKLAIRRPNKSSSLFLYKYSKKVFFDNLWHKNDSLLKARGIVLDIAGNIIQHPFDKVFNFGENDSGLDINPETEVIAVEKLNGFLGNIGIDPITKKLLITTTGSFDSDFVGYIEDFITPKLRGKLMKFLNQNPQTLSFEVVHPEDPHIIKYEENDMGLWLIGARELNFDSTSKTEEELDLIALELNFKRPKYFKVKFGDLKNMVKESSLEGFMVRDLSTQLTLLKFKTPYYLVTKFLGRMGDNKIKYMFASPKKFKESIDEEFYFIVDRIIDNHSLNDFLSMDNSEKIDLVRKFIIDMIN